MKLASIMIAVLMCVLPAQRMDGQWASLGALANENVMSFVNTSQGHVFAGTYQDGVYRSTDGGNSWTLVMSPSLYGVYEVFSLAVDASDNIYAGTYKVGLLRSTNDGASWAFLSNDTGPNNLPEDDIRAVTVLPSGTIFASDYGVLYRSTDAGATWTLVKNSSGGSAGGFVAIAYDNFTVPATVYIGGSNDWFYYSTDNGDHWSWIGSSSGLTSAPLSLAVDGNRYLYAGTAGGVFRSTDQGQHWSAVNTGLTNTHINTITVLGGAVLLVGTAGGGVFVSYDMGNTWEARNSGLTNLDIRALGMDQSGGDVFAGAYKSAGNGGLWRSGSGYVPVEVAAFHATPSARTVVLRWTTATEVNNFGFEVQRRKSGSSEWTDVAFVRGAGTSNSPGNYSYVDAGLPSGRYLYRLKQMNLDGSFSCLQTVEVEMTGAPNVLNLCQNYPNPFNPNTSIQFTLAERGRVSLKVYDILGKEVATLVDEERNAGVEYTETFDGSKCASGIYFCRLQTAKGSLVKKLMLVK